jgi:hypothetical protein
MRNTLGRTGGFGVRIEFTCDGVACEFKRSWVLGTTTLLVGQDLVSLQSATDPSTHVSLSLAREWEVHSGTHVIRVEKNRPPLLAAMLAHDYRVMIDGELVAQRRSF